MEFASKGIEVKFLALQKVLLLAKSGRAFAVPRNLRDHPLLQLHRPRAPSTPGSFAGTRASPSAAAAAGANSAGNLGADGGKKVAETTGCEGSRHPPVCRHFCGMSPGDKEVCAVTRITGREQSTFCLHTDFKQSV